MGHERHIEAMRDARHGLPPDGVRRADRRPRRRSRGRRLLRALLLLAVLTAIVVAAVAAVAALTGGGQGGGFSGTWEKSGPGTQLVIEETGDDAYTIAVSLGDIGGGDGDAAPTPRRVSKATLDGEVLTAVDMLGVPGLTVTFTLDDDGAVLVETFPNGSQDRLERVE